MIIFSKYLFHSSFNALAVWPFIFLKNKNLIYDDVLINHERIHLQQQKEMLWLLFFVWYFLEFFIKLIIYKQPIEAYRNLSFEREAYKYEMDFNYIKKRKYWNFINFL